MNKQDNKSKKDNKSKNNKQNNKSKSLFSRKSRTIFTKCYSS